MTAGLALQFVMASLIKRQLARNDLRPADRLFILERLQKWTLLPGGELNPAFTPEMLAMIEPAGDIEYAIFREARSLDPPFNRNNPRPLPSFDLIGGELFDKFCLLNPSIPRAMRMRAEPVMQETGHADQPE